MCLAIAFTFIAMQSCNERNASLIYDLKAEATGKVDFTWFNGGASIDGAAVVYQCNDTTKNLAKANNVVVLNDALVSNDSELAEKAAKAREAMLLSVNGVDGEYHLRLTGYIRFDKIIFAIDEEYPRTEPTPAMSSDEGDVVKDTVLVEKVDTVE